MSDSRNSMPGTPTGPTRKLTIDTNAFAGLDYAPPTPTGMGTPPTTPPLTPTSSTRRTLNLNNVADALQSTSQKAKPFGGEFKQPNLPQRRYSYQETANHFRGIPLPEKFRKDSRVKTLLDSNINDTDKSKVYITLGNLCCELLESHIGKSDYKPQDYISTAFRFYHEAGTAETHGEDERSGLLAKIIRKNLTATERLLKSGFLLAPQSRTKLPDFYATMINRLIHEILSEKVTFSNILHTPSLIAMKEKVDQLNSGGEEKFDLDEEQQRKLERCKKSAAEIVTSEAKFHGQIKEFFDKNSDVTPGGANTVSAVLKKLENQQEQRLLLAPYLRVYGALANDYYPDLGLSGNSSLPEILSGFLSPLNLANLGLIAHAAVMQKLFDDKDLMNLEEPHGLSGLAILPTQRSMRYKLLFIEVQKAYPQTGAYNEIINGIVSVVSDIAQCVNENVRKIEQALELIALLGVANDKKSDYSAKQRELYTSLEKFTREHFQLGDAENLGPIVLLHEYALSMQKSLAAAKEKKETEEKIARLEIKVQKLTDQLTALDQEKSQQESKLEGEIKKLQAELEQAQEEKAAALTQVQDVQGQMSALQKKMDELKAQADVQVGQATRGLFSGWSAPQQPFSDTFAELKKLQAQNQEQKAQIEQLQTQVGELAAAKAKITQLEQAATDHEERYKNTMSDLQSANQEAVKEKEAVKIQTQANAQLLAEIVQLRQQVATSAVQAASTMAQSSTGQGMVAQLARQFESGNASSSSSSSSSWMSALMPSLFSPSPSPTTAPEQKNSEAVQGRIAVLEAKNADLQTQYQQLQAQLADQQAAAQAAQNEQKEAAEAHQRAIEAAASEHKEEVERLQAQLAEAKVEQLDTAQRLWTANDKVGQLQQQIADAQPREAALSRLQRLIKPFSAKFLRGIGVLLGIGGLGSGVSGSLGFASVGTAALLGMGPIGWGLLLAICVAALIGAAYCFRTAKQSQAIMTVLASVPAGAGKENHDIGLDNRRGSSSGVIKRLGSVERLTVSVVGVPSQVSMPEGGTSAVPSLFSPASRETFNAYDSPDSKPKTTEDVHTPLMSATTPRYGSSGD